MDATVTDLDVVDIDEHESQSESEAVPPAVAELTADEIVAEEDGEDTVSWSGIIDRYLHDGAQITEYFREADRQNLSKNAVLEQIDSLKSNFVKSFSGRH